MNYRLVAKYLAYIAFATSAFLLPSVAWGFYFGEFRAVLGFLFALTVGLGVGAILYVPGRKAPATFYQREALVLVGVCWLLAGTIGALPFYFAGELSITESLFESVSGFTTTGASVLEEVERLPKCLLFWRSMTHWLGGMGIVVLFIAVLPYLGAGGKQLFKQESPGPEPRGLRPRIKESASWLWRVYVGLTVLQTVLFMVVGPMGLFDALCHTFATLATGGFSTHTSSIAFFNSFHIELIIIVFMVLAGTNFSLYYEFRRRLDYVFAAPKKGRSRSSAIWHCAGVFVKDTEWRVYIGILTVATVLVGLNLCGQFGATAAETLTIEQETVEQEGLQYAPLEAFRAAAFQVVSIMTTTGYGTENFDLWPPFSRFVLLLLMFVGGCAGSTGGGLKVVRIILMLKIASQRLERTFRPKTIRAIRISGHVVGEEAQWMLMGFMVVYGIWLILGVVVMSLLGLSFTTAVSAVIATLNNIGPGLELVGAHANYAIVPPLGKLYLTLCMVLGRLELVSISVLFMPTFWRIGR